MQLEDHLGDIIRKARAMSSVAAGPAAAAVGLSEADFAALESTGELAGRQLDFNALAKLLDLHPQKLAGIAAGWLPAAPDLSLWRELRRFTTAAEGETVNCYLAWDEVTRDAALFDTGVEAQPVLACLTENNLTLRHIFITHSHWDHVAALAPVREAWPKARMHTSSKNTPVEQRNKISEIVHLGGLRVTYRETPGHAEDGVTYLIGNWQEDAPHVAIVGDTIFAGSMGRGNPDYALARLKVREQILTLPPQTLICPGHGPYTTVVEEQAHNPFF